MYQNIASDTLVEHGDAILNFNKTLEEKAAPHNLNEKALVSLLNRLEKASLFQDDLYWLSLARINELAIVTAGNCAERCEFSLVGDLLLNPRLILIHVRGRQQPIVKERHTALTEQFRHTATTRGGVMRWLKNHTIVETRTKALLPYLLGRLRHSGLFCESYLAVIESREKRIADLSAYLACQHFESGTTFTRWLQNAGPEERDFMKSRLCRFDFRFFYMLGENIKRTANHVTYKSIFLKGAVDRRKKFGIQEREGKRQVGNLWRRSD